MNKRKIVKARKKHSCGLCLRVISIGDKYMFRSRREPVYADDVMGNIVQEGILYVKHRQCLRNDCYVYWINRRCPGTAHA